MTSPTVIFEDLPQSKRAGGRPSRHATIAAALRDRPQEWARIHVSTSRSGAYSVAHQVRHGLLPAYLPARHYEAKGCTVDGEFRVYARYVGAGGETE